MELTKTGTNLSTIIIFGMMSVVLLSLVHIQRASAFQRILWNWKKQLPILQQHQSLLIPLLSLSRARCVSRRMHYYTTTTSTLFAGQNGNNKRESRRQPQNYNSESTSAPTYYFDDANGGNSINQLEEMSLSSYSRPVIQWYPGHIAKAERLLQDTFFKAVDVVVEVRDARAVLATSHPSVPIWSKGKPRIVAITHVDQIPQASHTAWKYAFSSSSSMTTTAKSTTLSSSSSPVHDSLEQLCTIFVNAQLGTGIFTLKREIIKAGDYVQAKRIKRGLNERPLRVGIIGYPNVGKSSLINRLLGNVKRARAANTPGITRSLQWIRMKNTNDDVSATGSSNKKSTGSTFELLDTPGVIPAYLENQSYAILLAACNCIGMASYDNQAVASYLCQYMINMHRRINDDNDANNLHNVFPSVYAPQWRSQCIERYKIDPLEDKPIETLIATAVDDESSNNNSTSSTFLQIQKEHCRPRTGDDMLFDIAETLCQGSLEDSARKIIQDFRTGRMGPICLQPPPPFSSTALQQQETSANDRSSEEMNQKNTFRQQNDSFSNNGNMLSSHNSERNKQLLNTMKDRGLELPPSLDQTHNHQEMKSQNNDSTYTKDATKVTTIATGDTVTSTTSGSSSDDMNDVSDKPRLGQDDSNVALDYLSTTEVKSNSKKNFKTNIGKGLFDGW